jgi:DnaJ-domain-containing protein 1
MNHSITITPQNGALYVRTPYDPAFVAALKAAIPSAGRTWDGTRKTWVVAANYAQPLQAVVSQYYPGVSVPHAVVAARRIETRLLDVRYVGITKDRGDTERSAFGYAAGAWSVILPESELRRWFGLDADTRNTPEAATLYQVLNVPKTAAPEELKSAWRRMARQWHPDVCKEPDAATQFRRIQEAYELLSNPGKRARYDAALVMTAVAVQHRVAQYTAGDGFRPPLRCGYILAEGHEQLGRFLVSKILAWEDITQGGKTLVTSWPTGADTFQEVWT